MEKTFHIQWHITNLCSLRCRHCYQDRFGAGEDLPFKEVQKIFANICCFAESRNSKLVLDITGGEPLLYSRLEDIFTLAAKAPAVKEMGIITNGLSLEKKTVELLNSFQKLTAVKISAESITENGYEFYRGQGNYERFLQSCDIMQHLLKNKEKILMFTLGQNNAGEINGLFDFLEEKNFDGFILERFIPWGTGSKIKHNVISSAAWENTIKLLFNKCGLRPDAEDLLLYKGFMAKRAAGNTFSLFGAHCIAGEDGAAVMPDGSVFPCRRFPISIGSLRKTPLSHILGHSQIYKSIREKSLLKGKCKGCKINNCYGCRALAYCMTGDFLEEDPLCLKKTDRE